MEFVICHKKNFVYDLPQEFSEGSSRMLGRSSQN